MGRETKAHQDLDLFIIQTQTHHLERWQFHSSLSLQTHDHTVDRSAAMPGMKLPNALVQKLTLDS